jgi:hypothetical protein
VSATLVRNFAGAAANPQVISLAGKAGARDLFALFGVGATPTLPANWVQEGAFAESGGAFVVRLWRLPANRNNAGVTSLSIALNGAAPLAAVLWEDDKDAAVSAIFEAVQQGPTGSTPALWGTGLHTFTQRDAGMAFYFTQEAAADISAFDLASYDHAMTELGDSGHAGSGANSCRLWVAKAEPLALSSDGVTATANLASPAARYAAGMLAYDQGAPLPPTPVLGVAPTTLGFTYSIGDTAPSPASIAVANDGGGGSVAWTVADDAPWLSVSPGSGTAPSTLTVTINPTGLAVGSHTATITVTAAGVAGSPRTVAVTLDVAAQPIAAAPVDKIKRYRPTASGWRRVIDLPDLATTPELHGAKGDRRVLADAAITVNTAWLDSPSAPFRSTDVGKWVAVRAAGLTAQGGIMVAQIQSVASSTRAVLDRDAAATVSGQVATYGTDDTDAWLSAVAQVYSDGVEKGREHGRVIGSPRGYVLASPATKGGSTLGNAQVPLPRQVTGGSKFLLSIECPGVDGSQLLHWRQRYVRGGCILHSFLLGQTLDGTYGVPSVIGGPTNLPPEPDGTAPFSDMLVWMDGLTILAPRHPSLLGIDLIQVGQFNYGRIGIIADGTGGPTGDLAAPSTDDKGMALRMPGFQNNDNTNGWSLGVQGFFYAVRGADHFVAQRIAAIYCDTAFYCQPGGGPEHGGHIGYMSVEGCNNGFECTGGPGSRYPLTIDRLDIEVSGSGYTVKDDNDGFDGTWHYAHNGLLPPTIKPKPGGTPGAQNLTIIDDHRRSGAATAPSVPANGADFYNPFFRDAAVYVVGGTVTADHWSTVRRLASRRGW